MNKLFLSNKAIPIAVRDFSKIYHMFRSTISFDEYHSLNHLSDVKFDHFWTYCMKYFPKLFLYYQQGSKSLKEAMLVRLRVSIGRLFQSRIVDGKKEL